MARLEALYIEVQGDVLYRLLRTPYCVQKRDLYRTGELAGFFVTFCISLLLDSPHSRQSFQAKWMHCYLLTHTTPTERVLMQ